MSKECVVCHKRTATGNNVSKSHRKTRRTFSPNLQKVRIIWNGQKTRKYVCTSCIKSNKVEKYI